jgi:hypothetical protein
MSITWQGDAELPPTQFMEFGMTMKVCVQGVGAQR